MRKTIIIVKCLFYFNFQFESQEECEAVCVEETEITRYLIDKCEQPIKPGPCLGNFTR